MRKHQVGAPTSFRHSQYSGPIGMRVSAPRGNGGCPGNLVPSVDVRHFQFCTKRHRYHARIGPTFHLFHTGLARSRPLFAMTQHFTDLGDTPFWHLRAPKGAEMTSLRGCLSHPYLQAFVVCYGRHRLNTTNKHASGLVSATTGEALCGGAGFC